MNVILHDCIKSVIAKPNTKKNQGLIHWNIEKSIFSRKDNQFFIYEKAKNINHKLNKNLLTATTLFQREKKLIHIAPKNINGNAIVNTSKLNQITHRIDVESIVQTFAHNITANADINDKIPVHTNARTKTDITFELCNIDVVTIQLKKDLVTDEVNFFIRFLNHQWENDATTCHI